MMMSHLSSPVIRQICAKKEVRYNYGITTTTYAELFQDILQIALTSQSQFQYSLWHPWQFSRNFACLWIVSRQYCILSSVFKMALILSSFSSLWILSLSSFHSCPPNFRSLHMSCNDWAISWYLLHTVLFSSWAPLSVDQWRLASAHSCSSERSLSSLAREFWRQIFYRCRHGLRSLHHDLFYNFHGSLLNHHSHLHYC